MVYAHTLEGRPKGEWQPLLSHLLEVSRLAEAHAGAFGSGPWGALAGLWHDVGKFAADFQAYLEAASTDPAIRDASVEDGLRGRVDHSTAGAVLAYERGGRKFGAWDAALAMAISGHHSGLGNRLEFENGRLKKGEKVQRLRAAEDGGAPADILNLALPVPPSFLAKEALTGLDPGEKNLRFEFWTRMLFSALIDADRLDTEHFQDPARSAERERAAAAVPLTRLAERLDAHLAGLTSKACERRATATSEREKSVLAMRAEVLDACRAAALSGPGRFSLTVPTGGGKTLASLAFALGHAIRNGLRRVIVVIPFTSIIDQTAGVYREAFKECEGAPVLEHHSNLDPSRETVANRLCSENWDAPIIVTTSVQFFESLFSCKGTAARKLHNIARSVLVFDEVQSLPHGFRSPIFDGLNQLVDHYGCSALFCTATQPALDLKQVNRQDFPHLKGVREVIPDVPRAFAAVRGRVETTFPATPEPTTWESLKGEVLAYDRVLVIVQRRDDARDLCRLLPDDTFHLSALMCAAHRKAVLEQIKAIPRGKPCRIVATTLIEAGVDIDMDTVFRVLGGADAMAQAAGRCNREGRLCDAAGDPVAGRLILFHPPKDPPRELLLARDTTKVLLENSAPFDLFDPVLYDRYFHQFLSNVDPDRKNVNRSRKERNFPEVARKFRMIDDEGQATIVVPYEDATRRVDRYRYAPSRDALRALQPYTVSVRDDVFRMLEVAGLIETIHEQVHWLKDHGGRQYDPRFGLTTEAVASIDPARLIVP